MSLTTASHAMDTIHNDYTSGADLTSVVTVTDDPTQLNMLTQDTSLGTQSPTASSIGKNTSDIPPPSSIQPPIPLSTHTPTHAPTPDLDELGRPPSPTNLDNTGPTTSAAEPADQSSTTSAPDSLSTPDLMELAV